MKKPSRHHLNHEIKVDITGNNVSTSWTPWHDALRKTHHHICDVLVENTQPQSNDDKTQDEAKLRHMLQNNWQVLIKSVEILKKGKKQRNPLLWIGGD